MITAMVRTMPSLTGAAASGTITLDQGRNLSSASINLELKSDILKEVTKLQCHSVSKKFATRQAQEFAKLMEKCQK